MTFTEEQFIQATREVLAERGPNFIYEKPLPGQPCQYGEVDPVQGIIGSCLFGATLIEKLKVPYDKHWENVSIVDVLSTLGVDVSREVEEAAGWAQTEQDDGKTYSHVAHHFEERLIGTPYETDH